MSQQFARFPSLSGKTVFMTGGASGIGAEIVKAFSGQGAKVGFLDLDQTRSAELAEMLAQMSRLKFVTCAILLRLNWPWMR